MTIPTLRDIGAIAAAHWLDGLALGFGLMVVSAVRLAVRSIRGSF